MLPLLVVIYLGGNLLLIFTCLLAILACNEFYGAFSQGYKIVGQKFGFAMIAFLYLVYFLGFYEDYFFAWLTITILMGMTLNNFKVLEGPKLDGLITIIGVFYIGYLSFHIVLIDNSSFPLLIWLVLFTALGTDIFAYFSGYLFGKHKLCPRISPKKTVEGAIGGILGSTILCLLFLQFFLPDLLIHGFPIGILGSVFGQIGDLTASSIKRKTAIKDFGKLIPGHGGVLDRIDSLLFTAPFIYYYITVVLS